MIRSRPSIYFAFQFIFSSASEISRPWRILMKTSIFHWRCAILTLQMEIEAMFPFDFIWNSLALIYWIRVFIYSDKSFAYHFAFDYDPIAAKCLFWTKNRILKLNPNALHIAYTYVVSAERAESWQMLHLFTLPIQ